MKSHIIPKFYLKQFSFKKPNKKHYVWLYEKGKKPDPRWIDRAGVVSGYFGYVMPDGTLEESFEKTLAKMEHDCDDVLVCAISDLFVNSLQNRRKLIFYSTLLHSRATQRRDWTHTNWLQVHSQLKEALTDDGYVQA